MSWNEHPSRHSILNEVHSRPHELVVAPVRINHLVFFVDRSARAADREHMHKLLYGIRGARNDTRGNFVSADIAGIRVRWERHTEFVSYTFLMPLTASTPASLNAYDQLDAAWLNAIPGQLLVAQRLDVVLADAPATTAAAGRQLDAASLVGAALGNQQFTLYTDFRARDDGSVHFLLGVDGEPPPRRLGRYVQRILEIETYRMMALLGLPDAREASDQLETAERGLADLSTRLQSAQRSDETSLLEAITELATQVEAIYARSHTRFSASAAYYSLVDARVGELRQNPITGVQTVTQFLERRLGPAMNTCSATNQRLENLSRRIAHVSELLRTRVSIEQSESQYELLQTMTRRQGVQLKLQSAVEGLSIAAITYYAAGLIAYLSKAAIPFGWPVSTEMTVALSVPVIALALWLGGRRLHRRIEEAIRE